MNLQIEEILKQVKNAKCHNESAATLWLVACMSGLDASIIPIEEVDIQRLSRQGIVVREKRGIVITLNFGDSDISDEWIEEYRNQWKGLFTGSMGSKESIRSKVERWLNNNPKYSLDDILKAAKYWIESKRREVDNPQLIGQADYFIYKKQGKDEISRLSSVIDEIDNNPLSTWKDEVI